MKLTTTITPMTAAHLPRCGKIVDKLPLFADYDYTGARAIEQLKQALADPRAILIVAESTDEPRGRVLGFAWFVLKGAFDQSGYLRLIAVEHSAHGGGVGSQLMDHLEAQHLAPAGIALLVVIGNHAATRFYQRRGYQQVGTLPAYVRPELSENIFFKPRQPRIADGP